MPHGFEYIVRPFASPGSLGNVAIPGTPKRTPELARIVWGGQGTMPSTKLVNPDTVVNTRKEELTEQTRDNDRIRITGNDGESYVDVDRPHKITLDGKSYDNSYVLAQTMYKSETYLSDELDPYLKNFSMVQAVPGYQAIWHLNTQDLSSGNT